jgi:hypothetical protein
MNMASIPLPSGNARSIYSVYISGIQQIQEFQVLMEMVI